MPQVIIHKDGAYNLYTTVADGACYEQALTLDDLRKIIEIDHGQAGLDALPERLARAHATGCSALPAESLEACIAGNRCGSGNTQMPLDEFVKRYLTFPPTDTSTGPAA